MTSNQARTGLWVAEWSTWILARTSCGSSSASLSRCVIRASRPSAWPGEQARIHVGGQAVHHQQGVDLALVEPQALDAEMPILPAGSLAAQDVTAALAVGPGLPLDRGAESVAQVLDVAIESGP